MTYFAAALAVVALGMGALGVAGPVPVVLAGIAGGILAWKQQ